MAKKKTRWTSFRSLILKLGIVGVVVATAGIVYLDIYVRERFAQYVWSVPAKVYGAPLALYQGSGQRHEEVVWWLQRMGYRSASEIRGPGEFKVVSAARIDVFTRAYAFWDEPEHARELSLHFANGVLARLTTPDQRPVLSARLAPPLIGSVVPAQAEDRVLAQLASMPPTLVAGLVAVEDRRFFQHHGISPTAIARALVANVRSGRVEQGGSTITQQLVKNMFLTADQTLVRKGIEAIMAVLLELHVDKETILETYMNQVFIAQDGQRAIHGFGLAAQYFYGRPLEELSLNQQATLIGILRGPSYYSPLRNPERAIARRNVILDVMAEQRIITDTQRRAAQAEPLGLNAGTGEGAYAAALDLVRRQLRLWYPDEVLNREGLHIHTSIDIYAQDVAQRQMTDSLRAMERLHRLPDNTLQGALVLVHRDSGDVRAVVGARTSVSGGFNRALDARRPVGSLLKPAVYLAVLEKGQHWLTPVDDSPVVVAARDGSEWRPTNFDEISHGVVPMWEALTNSYNQAAARVGMETGLGDVLRSIERLGYNGRLPVVPSVILGAVDMTPYEVTQLYQPMLADGFRAPLKAITAVTTAEQEVLSQFTVRTQQVIAPPDAQALQSALRLSVQEGTGRYAGRVLAPALRPAGKTGTSDAQRDSWFAGEAGELLAVAWVGNDQNEPLPITGSTGALRVWTHTMEQLAAASVHQKPLHSALRYISWTAEQPDRYWLGDCQPLTVAVPQAVAVAQAERACPGFAAELPAEREDSNGTPRGGWRWLERIF